MKRGITALVVLGAVAAVNGGHHHASNHPAAAAKHHTAHHDNGYHKAKVVKHLNLGGAPKHHHIEHASVVATASKEQAMEKQELEMECFERKSAFQQMAGAGPDSKITHSRTHHTL